MKISGGEALAKSLVNEGVEVIFGIPGIQIYGIIAGLRDEPGIRMITTRHEQTTTYMADGYARASGRPGMALVVPSVGLYNAASGLANAYARSSPVLLIEGQVPESSMPLPLYAFVPLCFPTLVSFLAPTRNPVCLCIHAPLCLCASAPLYHSWLDQESSESSVSLLKRLVTAKKEYRNIPDSHSRAFLRQSAQAPVYCILQPPHRTF